MSDASDELEGLYTKHRVLQGVQPFAAAEWLAANEGRMRFLVRITADERAAVPVAAETPAERERRELRARISPLTELADIVGAQSNTERK